MERDFNREGDRQTSPDKPCWLSITKKKSRLPLLDVTYLGSIIDKSRLSYMMAEELGIGKDVVFVMDRGFCSTANRGFMHAGGISYVMGVDARHKTTRATIDTVRGGMDRVPAKPCGQRRLRERGTIKVLHGVIRDTRLLDITEHRHHRELDLFLYLDYRVQNNTDRTFKFVISLTPTHL